MVIEKKSQHKEDKENYSGVAHGGTDSFSLGLLGGGTEEDPLSKALKDE